VVGEVLTAKQAPHRPGTAPALGLRAGNDVTPFYRRPAFSRDSCNEHVKLVAICAVVDGVKVQGEQVWEARLLHPTEH
jgi:hypothetical protein